MTQNQIQYHNAVETERHNKMMESETNRHQMAQEQLQREANALQERANAINEAHYQRMDQINAMSLTETSRANRAREAENARSNVENEYIRSRANQISAASVAETSRHQKAQESIERSLNASLISKNQAQVSEIGANTGYIQARTKTEGWNTNLVIADMGYRNAQTTLANQQAQTEPTRRFANAMSGFNSGVGAISTAFKTIIPIIGSGSGTEGSTFWTQIDAMIH